MDDSDTCNESKFECKEELYSAPCSYTNKWNTNHNEYVRLTSQTLAQNRLIVSMLRKLELHLSKLLEKVRNELTMVQKNIVALKNGGKFLDPLENSFKFVINFCDIQNEDCIRKEANQELNLRKLPPISPWSDCHRQKLENVIVKMEIENRTNERNEEIKRLFTSLAETEKPEEKAEIKKRIDVYYSTEDMDLTISKKPPAFLKEEYDWVKISRKAFRGRFAPKVCQAMWHSYIHPGITKAPWSNTEDRLLNEAAIKYKFQNWDAIAEELGNRRSAVQCVVQYFSRTRLQVLSESPWSGKEDELLYNVVHRFKMMSPSLPWHNIASCIPGRSKRQVYDRWVYALNPAVKKGKFTKADDLLLIAAVRKYGKKFNKVAQLFPNRTSVQLRNRYAVILRMPKTRASWNPQDDLLLLKLVKQYGEGEWKKISDHFHCFDRVQVRHHYRVLQKRPRKLNTPKARATSNNKDCHIEDTLLTESCELAHKTGLGINNRETSYRLQKALHLSRKKGGSKQNRRHYSKFQKDFINFVMLMYSDPFSVEQTECDEQVETQFHQLSCVLSILKANLHIEEHNQQSITNHLLSSTDKQIVSLLRDRYLVSETQTGNELINCKPEPIYELVPVATDSKTIPAVFDLNSKNAKITTFTMPLNYTTLIGFQSLNVHYEMQKESKDKLSEDADTRKLTKVTPFYEQARSLFQQRLFSLFFWPALASNIEPNFSEDTESNAEPPKVRKRVPPSRVKKRRSPWLKKQNNTNPEPERKKRKYVKSGKYVKECVTDEVRRSSRIASASTSQE